VSRAENDGEQDQSAGAGGDGAIAVVVVDGEPSVVPVQVRVQVSEQSLGSAGGELSGAVGDVGVEDGSDTCPVRRDQPVVCLTEFGGDRAQAGGGVGGEFDRADGKVVAEHSRQAGAGLACGGPLHCREVVIDRRLGADGRGEEELGPARPVVDDQGPCAGQLERSSRQVVGGPMHPASVALPRSAVGELLEPGDGLRQRRDREPGLGQLGHAEIEGHRHHRIM
jgi:hypothetical protein